MTSTPTSRTDPIELQPIPWWQQLLLFGLPGLAVFAGTWFLVPVLTDAGMSLALAFGLCIWVPLWALIPVALWLYHRDGGTWTWPAFRDRFRLGRPRPIHAAWILLGLTATLVSEELTRFTVEWMMRIECLTPPEHFPAPFDPTKEFELPLTVFMDQPLAGNWLVLAILVPGHALMMCAEELMWRGYILPRQEKSFGRWAWLVNGLLWAYLVHCLLPWLFITFLAGMLIAPFVAQRCRNTWTSLGVHGLGNAVFWILVAHGIMTG